MLHHPPLLSWMGLSLRPLTRDPVLVLKLEDRVKTEIASATTTVPIRIKLENVSSSCGAHSHNMRQFSSSSEENH